MSAVIQRNEHHEIAQRESASSSLMAIINRAATDPNFDIDKLQRFLEIKERWDANEAIKAFNEAFAAFKSEAVVIIKNTEVKDGPLKGKKHANLFDVVVAVTPNLSKHGLVMSWKITRDDKEWIEVTCTLRHVAGHFESVSMGSGPDTGPGRNAIQARASAKSYLERYTATAILGLAAKDADDDGRGGEEIDYITDRQALDIQAMAEEIGVDKAAFLKYLGVTHLADLPASEYKNAIAALNKKRAKK